MTNRLNKSKRRKINTKKRVKRFSRKLKKRTTKRKLKLLRGGRGVPKRMTPDEMVTVAQSNLRDAQNNFINAKNTWNRDPKSTILFNEALHAEQFVKQAKQRLIASLKHADRNSETEKLISNQTNQNDPGRGRHAMYTRPNNV